MIRTMKNRVIALGMTTVMTLGMYSVAPVSEARIKTPTPDKKSVTVKMYEPIPMPEVFGPESYHEKEIEIFYNNIVKNVEDRIRSFI